MHVTGPQCQTGLTTLQLDMPKTIRYDTLAVLLVFTSYHSEWYAVY